MLVKQRKQDDLSLEREFGYLSLTIIEKYNLVLRVETPFLTDFLFIFNVSAFYLFIF